MMKAIFNRTLLALVAVISLASSVQAETLRTIRIGVPDQSARSEERRVGKECLRLCRSRWSPYH